MIFRRPWLVLLLVVCMLVFTTGMALRAWDALREWDFLARLHLTVSPLYLTLTGGVWGAAGLLTAVWLWRGDRRAPIALRTLTAGYVLYYWIDQILVMASPLRQSRWPFSAGVSAAAVVFVALTLMHPGVKDYFGGKYEQKDQP